MSGLSLKDCIKQKQKKISMDRMKVFSFSRNLTLYSIYGMHSLFEQFNETNVVFGLLERLIMF